MRKKDCDWNIGTGDAQNRFTWEQIKVSLLMDIRDELKKLNALFYCQNFLDIPHRLNQIRRAIPKRRPKRKTKP